MTTLHKKNIRQQRMRFFLAIPFLVSVFFFFASPTVFAKDYCYTQGECAAKKGIFTPPRPTGPQCTGGKQLCFAPPIPVTLSVTIGGKQQVLNLSDYIATVFNYGVSIAAVIAGLMMLVGGFEYLTAGDSGRVSEAKDRIVNAIMGLVLALGAFVILQTINPALLSLTLPGLPMVKSQGLFECNYFARYGAACGAPFGLALKPNALPSAQPKDRFVVVADPNDPTVVLPCTGENCRAAPGGNQSNKCVKQSANAPALPGGSNGYGCQACQTVGKSCTKGSECCSGTCGQGECTNGENGAACDESNDCRSGLCQTRFGNRCSSGLLGTPCYDNRECRNGLKCLQNYGVYVCVPQNYESYTTLNSNNVIGAPCFTPSGCGGGYCVGDAISLAAGLCTAGLPGERCDSDKDCKKIPGSNSANGHCYVTTNWWELAKKGARVGIPGVTIGLLASERVGYCTTGDLGAGCEKNNDCESDNCDAVNKSCVPYDPSKP